MKTFLKETLIKLNATAKELSSIVFLVPSKRAGLFLKKEILELYPDQTFFIPEIISIEEFIEQLSGLRQIDNIQSLFEFYNTYLNTHKQLDKDSFEVFCSWAQTLIYDFNEIDRYCIDHQDFFSYLQNIQDINHWSLMENKTPLVENYLSFWENLIDYYTNFTKELLQKNIGYQGLLYRKASENIKTYLKNQTKKHVLIGFNALNNSEQIIFKSLLETNQTIVFWDTDDFFMDHIYHEAGLFLRNYKKKWSYYQKHPFESIGNYFSHQKNIHLIGTPKNIGQTKYVGQILATIPKDQLEKTALILADETLLLPTLNSLPANASSINITMGMPLKATPLAAFFELLFSLQSEYHENGLYFKEIFKILLSQPATWLLGSIAHELVSIIKAENLVFFELKKLQQHLTDHHSQLIQLLFAPWKTVSQALDNCVKITNILKDSLHPNNNKIELEYTYHFHLVFNKLNTLCKTHEYVNSINALYQLYNEILTAETLDFQGEPFKGLQIMGMLESRCLDFENIIITSLNEGILPAGKSINSFIPFDLKKEYKLPTYKEKDAIYTYHFYRLIQRAKNIYLLYNTENEGVGGGEKSRFLLQLKIDKRPLHNVKEYVITSKIPQFNKHKITIDKNEAIIEQLKKLAFYGLSPSAITTYIRNPIQFYYQYILGIKEDVAVEETIAANTLGTVIHNTLENFYKPLEGQFLKERHLEKMMQETEKEVNNQFKETYSKLDLTKGKNFLIYEVTKQYVHNFIKSEVIELKKGNTIKIIAIENNLKTQIDIPELAFPVYIKGKVDRIDQYNGETRIIDYKTGKVTKGEVIIQEWDVLCLDYKYSKIVQVLAYSYMFQDNLPKIDSFCGGIISFKNLKEGFLKFGTKKDTRSKANHTINNETFDAYLIQLKKLIIELFDTSTPFLEKEI